MKSSESRWAIQQIRWAGWLVVAAVAAAATPSRAADDDLAAIRDRAASYQAAYNRHDAKAVADHWSDEGEYALESGERIRGRKAIQRVFEELFKADNSVQLQVTITALRLVTPDVAIEDGKAEIVGANGPGISSSYTAVNVKKNGVWYVDSVRQTELPAPPSHFDKLKDLSWMIGEWMSTDENSAMRTKVEWAKNKNFITRSFTIHLKDQPEMSGTQVIGWDASRGQIRSWTFDSDGGIAEGIWTKNGNRWSCKTLATLPDGRNGSAEQIITCVDENTITCQAVGRELHGTILPDIKEFKVIRVTGE